MNVPRALAKSRDTAWPRHMTGLGAAMPVQHATRGGRARTDDGRKAIERCRSARGRMHPFPLPRSGRTLGRSNPGRIVDAITPDGRSEAGEGIGADQAPKKQRKTSAPPHRGAGLWQFPGRNSEWSRYNQRWNDWERRYQRDGWQQRYPGDQDQIEIDAMTAMSFSLRGTGIGLPKRRVSSASLDRDIGRREGWLEATCGVSERYVCDAEAQDELAAVAARDAIAEADIPAASIDLLIFASAIPKYSIPATAPLIARHLGIPNGGCTTLDVNSTCLSFLSGFDVATAMISAGRHGCALVVSSEIASRALPWRTDPATAGLFGDGAAAAVVTAPAAGQASSIRAILFETHHDGYEACQLAAGGTGIDFHREPERFAAGSFFQMNGRELFKLTSGRFPKFVDRVLARAQWDRRDVDVVIPHQASALALAHLVKRCGFARDRVVDIVRDHGNQIAASIPTALHVARRQGLIKRGSKVLLLGTSAGVSFGGIAIEM